MSEFHGYQGLPEVKKDSLLPMPDTKSALSRQEGGSHYKECAIQPIQYIEANKIAFLEGCVIKRCTRHDKPTGKGKQDIEKAIHELQLMLQLRYP